MICCSDTAARLIKAEVRVTSCLPSTLPPLLSSLCRKPPERERQQVHEVVGGEAAQVRSGQPPSRSLLQQSRCLPLVVFPLSYISTFDPALGWELVVSRAGIGSNI